MDIVLPDIVDDADGRILRQLNDYAALLLDYNTRVNLMSRKSVMSDVQRHIAHCLCLAQKGFPSGSKVVDWGSGGGLPAIPLGIVFPDIEIVAVETVGKKTKAISFFIEELSLSNVQVWQGRAESYTRKYHYSVSRATARLSVLWSWHIKGRIPLPATHGDWTPGLFAFKGGDLTEEIAEIKNPYLKIEVDQRTLIYDDVIEADNKYLLCVHDKRSVVKE